MRLLPKALQATFSSNSMKNHVFQESSYCMDDLEEAIYTDSHMVTHIVGGPLECGKSTAVKMTSTKMKTLWSGHIMMEYAEVFVAPWFTVWNI